MAYTTTRVNRTESGAALIELLVATVIITVVSMAMLGVILLNNKSNGKVMNVDESVNAARIIKERIGKDVRMGRNLGDVYGQSVVDAVNNDTVNVGSDSFPASNNPVYGAGETPPGGWPGGTFGGPPYQLNNQTLIVQIPITDNHNDSGTTHATLANAMCFPTCIKGGQGNPAVATGTNVDNVETHIYKIVADPANPGVAGNAHYPKEYLMQVYVVPGYAVSGTNTVASPNYTFDYIPAAHVLGPQTILSGIIGPLDSAGDPVVFQFLNKTDSTGAPNNSILPVTVPSGQFVGNYTGVVINLELRRHTMTNDKRTDISFQPVGFKTEVFLRNNAEATPSGQPQTSW